jgi:hypothetical protein
MGFQGYNGNGLLSLTFPVAELQLLVTAAVGFGSD